MPDIAGGEVTFPELEGKKVGFILQKEEYLNRDGEKKFKMNLLHWLDFGSLKTYRELIENKPAKTAEMKVQDLLVETAAPQAETPNAIQDDLPF